MSRKSSCIKTPPRDPMVIVRAWQLAFVSAELADGRTASPGVRQAAAALLSYLIFCHDQRLDGAADAAESNDVAVAHGENGTQDESLWIGRSLAALDAALMIFGERTIEKAIQWLVDLDCVKVGPNPNRKFKFDKRRFFLLNPTVLNDFIDNVYGAPVRNRSRTDAESLRTDAESLRTDAESPYKERARDVFMLCEKESSLLPSDPAKDDVPVVLADKRAGKSKAKKEKPRNPMHARVRSIIGMCYSHCNEGLQMPWGGEAAGKLAKLLRDAPGWQPRDWALCVARRFGSTAAAVSEPPASWIKSLPKYRASEFDRFGKAADSDSALTVELMQACADAGLADEECE